jgi:hypothetical protein
MLMFLILLQHNAIGGNLGQLSIGELPAGMMQGSLMWAEVRRYNQMEGGLVLGTTMEASRYLSVDDG